MLYVTLKKFYDVETGLWHYKAETSKNETIVDTIVNFADYNYNHILSMTFEEQVHAITKTMADFDYMFMNVVRKAAAARSKTHEAEVTWDDGCNCYQRETDAHRILQLLHQAGPNSIFTNLLNIEKTFI